MSLSFAPLLAAAPLCVVSLRPTLAFFALLAIAHVNPAILPPIADVGGFTIRMTDIPLAGLVMWLLGIGLWNPQALAIPPLASPVVLFLLWTGLSTAVMGALEPVNLARVGPTWIRLAVESVVLFATYNLFPSSPRRLLLVRVLSIIGLIAVFVAVVEYIIVGPRYALTFLLYRTGGLLGTNTLGLVSGCLILIGVSMRSASLGRLAPLSIIAGILGLFTSKSISATAATLLTLALINGLRYRTLIGRATAFALGTMLAAGVIALVAWVLRSSDVRALLDLAGGSFTHRVYLAGVGLRIFADHPVFGVGWQLSSSPRLLAAAGVPQFLSEFTLSVPGGYLVDVAPFGAHNLYIQALAELGVVGVLLCLAGACVAVARVIRIGRRVAADPLDRGLHLLAIAIIILLLVWWNTTTLFPGQLETLLLMIFVGFFGLPRTHKTQIPL